MRRRIGGADDYHLRVAAFDRTGTPVARFASDVEPEDANLTQRIEAELAR